MLEKTNIESLPDNAIFDILLRLPAQDIYEAARFVCSRWFLLARTHDFVRAHLHQSTHGLLIQDLMTRDLMDSWTYDRPILVRTRTGRIEISNFENYKFIGIVMSSCNGLILETCESRYDRLYITNPATKQQFALPTNTALQISAIAYAAATKEYKVVHAFCDDLYLNPTPDGVAILTVGVDMDWTRRVDIQHLSLKDRWLLREAPLATQGFVHWAAAKRGEKMKKGEGDEYVLTLNVDKEAFSRSRVPCLHREGERLWYHYLSTGSRLSVLFGLTGFSWEVWEMESETGEWRKVMRVDLEAEKCVLEGMGCEWKEHQITPVGWLKFGEVLVFSSVGNRINLHIDHRFPDRVNLQIPKTNRVNLPIYKGFTFAYNVGTHEIESFELDSGFRNFVVHRNSLVWLN